MIHIKSTDGTKIAVYDYNPSGSGTVFLVHGWPLSGKMYEYQVEMLLQYNYRVVVIDLRGFGESEVPAHGYSYQQMAADIYSVVRALRLTQIILVGFSMGGAIALRYMRLYKGYGVKRLILLAAAAPCWTQRPGFPYGLSKSYVNQLIQLAATDRPQLAYQFAHDQLFASPQSEAAMNWFEDIALSASGIGTIRCAVSLRDEDGRADLTAVHVPTILIHGAKDAVVSNDLIQVQWQNIRDSRLYTLENSGHGVVYDQLEDFNQIFLLSVGEADCDCALSRQTQNKGNASSGKNGGNRQHNTLHRF